MKTTTPSRICAMTLMAAAGLIVAGCSEPVGRTKETKKEVVDTPTGKTTTTETREKNTRIDPQ